MWNELTGGIIVEIEEKWVKPQKYGISREKNTSIKFKGFISVKCSHSDIKASYVNPIPILAPKSNIRAPKFDQWCHVYNVISHNIDDISIVHVYFSKVEQLLRDVSTLW